MSGKIFSMCTPWSTCATVIMIVLNVYRCVRVGISHVREVMWHVYHRSTGATVTRTVRTVAMRMVDGRSVARKHCSTVKETRLSVSKLTLYGYNVRRLVLVVNCFRVLESITFCLVVGILDLHVVTIWWLYIAYVNC